MLCFHDDGEWWSGCMGWAGSADKADGAREEGDGEGTE